MAAIEFECLDLDDQDFIAIAETLEDTIEDRLEACGSAPHTAGRGDFAAKNDGETRLCHTGCNSDRTCDSIECSEPTVASQIATDQTNHAHENRNNSGIKSLIQQNLFGRPAIGYPTAMPKSSAEKNLPLELPTHHALDKEAIKTWVYPSQLSQRDYQYSISHQGLFQNILVSLPTGLGKTFIAAVIMLNWYRWAPQGKVVFMAPTRPLVAQQVDACCRICGIPPEDIVRLTGQQSSDLRKMAWESKRMFFMTPETLRNDLKSCILDARSIVCLVVDEAHRAQGSYAYVEVVKLIRQKNKSFRILALSATPGSKIDDVQAVIDGLCISKIEARTEDSFDIRPYVHKRSVKVMAVSLSSTIIHLLELFAKVLARQLAKVSSLGDYRLRDPLSLTQFGVHQAKTEFTRHFATQNVNPSAKGKISAVLLQLIPLAHALTLLQHHGIRCFYNILKELKQEAEIPGQKMGKTRADLIKDLDFQTLMLELEVLMSNPETVSHPKIDRTTTIILDHFAKYQEANLETRVIVFAQYRDSAEEICNMLKRHLPMIKPTVFVGQAMAKQSVGMSQKEQLDTLQRYSKGEFNVLVATSIGEEGLDIGDVDLIVTFDTSASPVRMLQRFGRAGRKRAGYIYVLVTEGKEERNYIKAQDAYEKMQLIIASGDAFSFHEDKAPRILPPDIMPVCEHRNIAPVGDVQAILTTKKKLLPPKKAVQKTVGRAKRKLPQQENIIPASFVSASSLSLPEGDDIFVPSSLPSAASSLAAQYREGLSRLSPHCVNDWLSAPQDHLISVRIPAGSLTKKLLQLKRSISNSVVLADRFASLVDEEGALCCSQRRQRELSNDDRSSSVGDLPDLPDAVVLK